MHPLLTRLLLPALCAISYAAHAEPIVIKLSVGTGFFVSDDGYLVTNYHVVEPCKQELRVENRMIRSSARLVAHSSHYDLALLKINRNSPGVVVFRNASEPPVSHERIVVLGHPLGGALTTQEGLVESAKGPRGEAHFMQFSNLVKQGNSGGPLLDTAGRLVGMVTAKAKQLSFNRARAREETVHEMDIAITGSAVLDFITGNGIYPRFSLVTLPLSADRIQDHIRDAVVKVTCQVDGA